MLIVLVPNDPMASALVVYNDLAGANATGYYPLEDTDWGSPSWAHTFTSRGRGSHGPRVAMGTVDVRQVLLSLRVAGTSKDDLAAKLIALTLALDKMRRLGGTIVYRANGQTYRQYLRVLTCTVPPPSWNRRMEMAFDAVVKPMFSCAPYADGDAMEFYDNFVPDTLAAGVWTYDAGATGNLVASGGVLQQVSPFAVERRIVAQHTGYGYGDVELRADTWWPGATNANVFWYLMLKRLDASNYIHGMLFDNGSVSSLGIEVVSAGGNAQSSYPNLASRLGSTSGFQQVTFTTRIEGNVVYCEVWYTKRWTPSSAADLSASLILNSAMADKFGELVTGSVGIGANIPSASSASFLDNFVCEPFVYRRRAFPIPGLVRLAGAIPGDVAARTDIEVAAPSSVSPVGWGLLGWSQRSRPWNMCWNGGGEGGNATLGWTNAGIAGIQNNTGAISQVTTPSAKYGSSVLQSATPGGQPYEGPIFTLRYRFKKGQRYTAVAWVRQTAGTATTFDVQLGAAAGDKINTTGTGNLTAGVWAKRTVTWQPQSDFDVAYVSLMTSGTDALAHAGTFQWDGVAVWEGSSEPSSPPALQSHVEGLGGPPPFGLYSVLSCLANTPANFILTNGTGIQGYSLGYTQPNNAAAGSNTVMFVFDPNLLIGDDYAGAGIEARLGRPLVSGGVLLGQQPDSGVTEVDVEIYARMMIPERTTISILTAVFLGNSVRYSKEYGSSSKSIVGWTGTGTGSSMNKRQRLGTFTLPIQPDGSRWVVYMVVTWGTVPPAGGLLGIDFLEFLPARRRAGSPTGKSGDSSYPFFLQNANTGFQGVYTVAEAAKLVRSDLSADMAYPPLPQRTADHGLAGSMIELPPGNTDGHLTISGSVPEDPVTTNTGDAVPLTASLRFSPRPRYAILRPVSG